MIFCPDCKAMWNDHVLGLDDREYFSVSAMPSRLNTFARSLKENDLLLLSSINAVLYWQCIKHQLPAVLHFIITSLLFRSKLTLPYVYSLHIFLLLLSIPFFDCKIHCADREQYIILFINHFIRSC